MYSFLNLNIFFSKYRTACLLVATLMLPFLLISCRADNIRIVEQEDQILFIKDNITIEIDSSVLERQNIYEKILLDVGRINSFYKIKGAYIVVDKRQYISTENDKVSATPNSVGSEKFRKELIKHTLDIYDNWKLEGLYRIIFEENSQDANFDNITDANLKMRSSTDFASYYRENEFSLFGIRFYPSYCTKQEAKNLKDASYSLVRFFLDNNQKEKLLENVELKDIKPWAKEHNISLDYMSKFYDATNGIYVSEHPFSKIVVDTKRKIGGFTLNIVMEKDDKYKRYEKYDSAHEIEQMIFTFEKDIANNLEVIKKDAPNFYKEYQHILTNVPKVVYYLDSSNSHNYHVSGANKIFLKIPNAQMSEYNHYLLNAVFQHYKVAVERPMWALDGVDSYLNYVYSEGADMEEFVKMTLYSVNEKQNNQWDRIYKISNEVMSKNVDESNLSQWIKEPRNRQQVFLIFNSLGIRFKDEMVLKNIDIYNKIEALNDNISVANNNNVFANYSFCVFMIERYGLEKMLYLGIRTKESTTFEDYFGKRYDALLSEWAQYIKDNVIDGEKLLNSG